MGNNSSDNPFFNITWDEPDSHIFEYPDHTPLKREQENHKKKRSMIELQEALNQGKKLNSVEVIRLRRYHALNWITVSDTLARKYQKAIKNKNLTSRSKIEQKFYNEIKKIFPDALRNHWIDGIEIDIFIPSEKVIIEVDGKYRRKR